MDLKIKDLVELFQVSEKTIYRWIKEKKIPVYRINYQYRFSRSEINEWILKNKIEVSGKIIDLNLSKNPLKLLQLLKNGGIFYDIDGRTIPEVIDSAVKSINIPPAIKPDELISALLDREAMMSTSIGKGIAIPHPRNPIITEVENAGISICFLKKPIDYKALDHEPVHTMFIVLTANPRRHLEVLAKISYLCQQEAFRELLKKRADRDTLFTFIDQIEQQWLQRQYNHE